jgi:hypothetical protein
MRAVALSLALLTSAAAHADEASWILQPDLTPTRLAERGAVLTASDFVRWPSGPSVDLSYWLGDGDIVYRCAELAAEAATNASCWRLEVVAADQSRVISTRQRPVPAVDASQPVAVQPYVWWNGMPPVAERPSQPPRPRPTPLPTPAP